MGREQTAQLKAPLRFYQLWQRFFQIAGQSAKLKRIARLRMGAKSRKLCSKFWQWKRVVFFVGATLASPLSRSLDYDAQPQLKTTQAQLGRKLGKIRTAAIPDYIYGNNSN